ncbi:MAG: GNAT family N-acetyltransferase [Actinomycetota bacterium]|nr:GNAT family N-acetyltransferase [Actinomycetota bacterium]MDH5313675.1 GNAT family N-acetyltransferase [Actinomycetota bacterium]
MIDADGLLRADHIASRRLRLSPLVPAHAEELFPVLDDDRLHEFTGGQPDTIEQLRARLERWAAERSPDGGEAWLNWLVRSVSDDRIVGTMQATVARGTHGQVAVVAWTVGVEEQGRGVASEAARAVVEWLIAWRVRRIEAHVHPAHAVSAAVARSAGLSQTDEVVDGEVVWRRSIAPPPGAG